MKRNGIGCLGTIIFFGSIVGAIGSFSSGETGVGWFCVVIALVVPYVFGAAMNRASTAGHAASSEWGRRAGKLSDQAMQLRDSGDYAGSEVAWGNAMAAATRAIHGKDKLLGLMTWIFRYTVLRADHRSAEAGALMVEIRNGIRSLPAESGGMLMVLSHRLEQLSDRELAGVADGTKALDDLMY